MECDGVRVDKYATLGTLYELKGRKKKTNNLIKTALTFWSYESLIGSKEKRVCSGRRSHSISACVGEVTKCALHIICTPASPQMWALALAAAGKKRRRQRCLIRLREIRDEKTVVLPSVNIPGITVTPTSPITARSCRSTKRKLSTLEEEEEELTESRFDSRLHSWPEVRPLPTPRRLSVPVPRVRYHNKVRLRSFTHLLEGPRDAVSSDVSNASLFVVFFFPMHCGILHLPLSDLSCLFLYRVNDIASVRVLSSAEAVEIQKDRIANKSGL